MPCRHMPFTCALLRQEDRLREGHQADRRSGRDPQEGADGRRAQEGVLQHAVRHGRGQAEGAPEGRRGLRDRDRQRRRGHRHPQGHTLYMMYI